MKIFVHGSGHRAASWKQTLASMKNNADIVCPELSSLTGETEATYANLYSAFSEYCDGAGGDIHLCGLSLGGILAMNYASDHPDKVGSLVLIGTPHKIPGAAFALQNLVFRLLPKSVFRNMAFNKKNTFVLGNSMKRLDLTDMVRNIVCPTLIVCGEKDRANIASARFLAQNIGGSALRIVENTGHVVSEENPEALAKILDEYYEAIMSKTGRN